VVVDRIALRSSISSAADLAKGLVFGNPIYEEIIAHGGNPQKICQVVAEAIGDQLASDMPLQALVIVASKA
jgi:hypothetical protein